MSKVKIAGLLTPEEALAVLFNASGPQGLGKLQYTPGHTMAPEEATKVLEKGKYVDYLEGRVIKVDFGNRFELDTTLYDRDNGKDAAETAIFIELDRRKGGNFKQLNRIGVPLRLMGSKVERIDGQPEPVYRYYNVMGGTFEICLHHDVINLCSNFTFSFFHPMLKNEYMSLHYYIDELHGHHFMFNVMVRRVLDSAIDKMLNKEGGPNE